MTLMYHDIMIYRAANISILQSGRFSSPIRKIYYITYDLMDKKFPESGRLSNLCTRIGLFSLKIRKSSAESGRVGSSGYNIKCGTKMAKWKLNFTLGCPTKE